LAGFGVRRKPCYSVLGQRLFTDGEDRTVYSRLDGKQYVLDDHGEPVVGVRLLKSDNGTKSADPADSTR
jgi:hypothetical protein